MKHRIFQVFCLFLTTYGLLSCTNREEVNVSIAKYKGDKVCALSYTFDDGLKEHATLAAPQLEKNGFSGTFWVNGSRINGTDSLRTDTTRMSWTELKEMSEKGHEISNHMWSHRKLTAIPLEDARREIIKNDSILFKHIGIMPVTLCYPYNSHNEEIREMASLNRVGTRTSQFSMGHKSTPGNLDRKIEELIHSEEWGVAMIHGITYGYDAFPDANVLWDHLEKVKNLEDKVWVGTFREVISYIKEREETELEIKQTRKGVTIVPELFLDKRLYTEPLTAVVEKDGIRKASASQDNQKLEVQILPEKLLVDFNPAGGPVEIHFN